MAPDPYRSAMITGLRAADAAVLQRLAGGDQRLFLRLGALLQARLAISESALAEAAGNPGLKKLLLDRRLKDATPEAFAALASDCGAADCGVVLVDDRDGRTETGWRVLALEDELDNPLLADEKVVDAVADAPPEAHAVLALLPTLGPAIRAPVEVLLAARADDQRAAALEQLRYVAPPLSVVGELMPMLLADGADIVRERALGLLVASGAHVAVIDLVRALTRDDAAALARLGAVIARLPAVQVDLACAALIAVVGRGQATQATVGVCVHLAQHLAAHRGLERLLELLISSKLNLVDLVRALQEHAAARVDAALGLALGQGDASDTRLITLLAGPHRRGDDRLLGRGVELLLSPREEPRERMGLAIALRRLDLSRAADVAGVAGVAERIAAVGMALGASRDTSVYWLLAELSRDGRVDRATADAIVDVLRRILREGEGTHAIAIIDQQLPAHLPASDDAKASLVEPIGELAARFRDERTADVVGTCLSSIGLAATPGLWRLIADHPHQAVRLLAAGVLPDVLQQADVAQARDALDRLLAIMDRSGNGAERAATLTAAARLAAGPLAGDSEATQRIDQATRRLGEWAVDALGWFASGEHIDPSRRIDIVESLLASVLADLPDTPLEHELDANTQETTFVLDPRLGIHTESVPRALRALARIAGSPHLPAPLTRRIVEQLCAQWKRVSTWEIVWGPANIQELGRALAGMAARDGFPVALRIRVCESLLPSIGQLSIARALASVFRHAEGLVADLAGRACARLIQLASGRHFADDEQEELAETLIDFLAVPGFGQSDDPLRRRLVGLVSASRAHMGSRARARLREARARLPADLQQRLEWA